jgi:hypothetical protein
MSYYIIERVNIVHSPKLPQVVVFTGVYDILTSAQDAEKYILSKLPITRANILMFDTREEVDNFIQNNNKPRRIEIEE